MRQYKNVRADVSPPVFAPLTATHLLVRSKLLRRDLDVVYFEEAQTRFAEAT